MNARRLLCVVLVASIATLGMSACQVRVAGTRCRVPGATAQDATHVLVCKQGRWRRTITKAQAAMILVAVINARTPVGVAAGNGHTCMSMKDSNLRCWGFNSSGQLGDGTTTSRLVPTLAPGATTRFTTQLSGGSPVVETNLGSIDAGAEFTCTQSGGQFAATPSYSTSCWGYNGFGQFGDGSTTNRLTSSSVSGGNQTGVMAAGTVHLCIAVGFSGAVQCAGQNAAGQLGNGATTPSSTKVDTGLSGVAALAAGSSHTCALKGDGAVWCWGANGSGQLGDGTTTQRTVPTLVPGLSASAITAGGDHTCALLGDGTVKCWGANADGQLGIGTTVASSSPVAVLGLGGVTALSAGADHSCAVLTGGGLWCWGANATGQLGTGDTTTSATPHVVQTVTGATAVSAGFGHTCAIAAGKGWCWGRNDLGQLGDGTTVGRLSPVQVAF